MSGGDRVVLGLYLCTVVLWVVSVLRELWALRRRKEKKKKKKKEKEKRKEREHA